MTSAPTVRRAGQEDAAALVDLRAAMIESVNGCAPADNGWRQTCERMLRDKLAPDSQEWAAYVVDGPDGVPVSCVVGWVMEHLPGPRNVSPGRGYVASMSTAPDARGKGFGRAVFAELMEWFDVIGIDEVALLASDMGEPLYADFGFTVSGPKAMVWLRRR
ncbi:MAG: GNAT family N-acetyltransferase [Mycobacteriales bacterium]